MIAIEKTYRRRTNKSAEFTARAERVMPGSETRSGVYHWPYSVVLERGQGACCWDIDGNEYLDFHNNYTVLVHGHAFPPVVEAAVQATRNGSTWAAKNVHQLELSELLVERVPSVEQVRYANSGTEAVLVALAVARAVTGRRKFLMARYGFHGHVLKSEFGDEAPHWFDVEIGDYGSAESFESILAKQGSEIAAVLLEPVMGAAGVISAPKEFFDRVHAAAKKAGAVFILDEATCFRLSTGGAQKAIGIDADLTVLGKIVAGGFPGGAIGGRAELMAALDPTKPLLSISGTFSGNPVSMAAGFACLSHLTEDVIGRMAEQARQVDAALHESAARHGLPFSIRRAGSTMNVYFSPEPPAANQVRDDKELMGLFQLACLNNGIFMVPRGSATLSSAFTDDSIAEAVQRLDAAMADVAAAV